MFKKVLIANRGEISLRIIRACKELGIRSVAVYSDADKESLPVRYADESVYIGKPLSRKSYLNIDNILGAAKKTGVEAVHPGYGFLAENASFARACQENGFVFIGPSCETIARAGDKSTARKTVSDLGVPVIPGSNDVVMSEAQASDAARAVGYPVMIKATGGGGGRGIRIVNDESELGEGLKMASGETRVAFANPDVYLEKYLEAPRHIEIQIIGDKYGNYVHLGERECSVQRRHQKVIEESPSPFVDDELRHEMGRAAIEVARAAQYVNAGTVEFLVDKQKNYYFMEINSRIQVEHPVTEMVTGEDLIHRQILIAAGEELALRQDDIRLNGWSIECRINAEDPDNDFMPCPGTINNLILPSGPGVRVDTHLYDNYEVPPFYDSLICKLVVWAANRDMAIKRMRRALDEFRLDGIKVTVPFHSMVLANKDFISGDINTRFLDRFDNGR